MKKGLFYLPAGIDKSRRPAVHPTNLLVSATVQCKTKFGLEQTVEMIENIHEEDRFTMIDLGGYSAHNGEKNGLKVTFESESPLVLKGRINIPPEPVVEVAKIIKANSMIALDFPILTLKNKRDQNEEFFKKLGVNVDLAVTTSRLREKICPETKLLIPAHVNDLVQFDLFYSKIKHIEFDGIALPVRNFSMTEIYSVLMRMHELRIGNIHLLGTSSLKNISLCAFMTKYFDRVSFDSTSWLQAAIRGGYYDPRDLRPYKLNHPGIYDLPARCFCKVCDGKSIGEVQALENKERSKLLLTHNFLAIDGLVREFQNSEFSAEYFQHCLAKSKRNDIKEIINNLRNFEERAASLYHRAA